MAEITAALVKELREKTGAGMMDCKRALAENSADLEAAIDWLRKKGLSAAAKKAGRVAAEGLVGVATDGSRGAIVEINAETDFVGRNPTFQDFVQKVATLALKEGDDVERLKTAAFPGTGRNVGDELAHLIATIGENMTLRRARRIDVPGGTVASYVHSALAPGVGKIGVLVALAATGNDEKLAALGKNLAMHIAAANPRCVDVAQLDRTLVERERAILVEQARASGKPDNVIEKMVEGRLRKFHEDVVLLEQLYVIDGESRVKKVIADAQAAIGGPVGVVAFERFQLGEGVEKAQTDFAAEVAAQVKA